MTRWIRKSGWLALPMAAVLSFTSLAGIGAPKAHAFASSDADTAIKAFNTAFWDAGAKFFRANSGSSDNQGFWIEAELWELVMDAYDHTTDDGLKAKLRTQIDDIFDGTVAKYGDDWTNNHFNDDIMWWAMASARAYQITKEQRYLDKAKYYFHFVYDTQWDDNFAGGGIWWMNSEHTTKNACINFPAAEAAVFLYDITKDDEYLDAASKIYRWGKTMLTDGNGKVFDRIEQEHGAVPDATHYNQGTFIGAAVGLYRVTGNPVYLNDAVKAAAFTKAHLTDGSGLLRYEGPNGDLKGGKTILVRNLAYLQQALNQETDPSYKAFAGELDSWLAYNTDTAWNNRNAENLVDGNWSGQLLGGTYDSWSAAAAVEALTVLKPGNAAPPQQAPVSAYDKIEAENYSVGYGFGLEGSAEGTLQLAGIQPGYYAVYRSVDFGSAGAAGVIARAASATGGGNIEIRLDSLDGPLAGTVNVQGTGSWNTFTDAVTAFKDGQGNPAKITGVHDVYLVFTKTNDTYLFNLNWFKFTASDPSRTDAYARLKAGNYDDGKGFQVNKDQGDLESIQDGAYAMYKGIDFGAGAPGVTVHAASGGEGGRVEIRLDAPDGPLAGTIGIPATGGEADWLEIMGTVDDKLASGVHDVYLVFHGTDGGDVPFKLDWFSFTTVKGQARDAYGKLEAEDSSGGTGFGTENGGGQTYLAGIYGPNNPYAMYNYIDFGSTSPAKMYVNAASDTGGGTIEVRTDSLNGPLIATLHVPGTGGWQNFQVSAADLTAPVTGKHIVFLLFKGNDWLFNLDKFTFGDPAVFTAPPVQTEPVSDHVPPGDVENVQVIRTDEGIRLYWDGPYDVDGQKEQIALFSGGRQAGDTAEVARGVQTVMLPADGIGQEYSIAIKSVDASGNVSSGITVDSKELPFFSLTADGKAIDNGGQAEDWTKITFSVWDHTSSLTSAVITLNGKDYVLDPRTKPGIDIDLAGNLGDTTAVATLADAAGNRLSRTFDFRIVTSVHSMQQLVSRFQASGELGKALASQLANALKQAQQQLDIGKRDQAGKHMQDFVKSLNREALSGQASERAKTALNADAQWLLDSWR
ncbi:carbohydrate-binding protein [Paenibacillus humicola]|uniref:carbohydrate-binding protein n=1 Tax=Paenibacillus humicola TaxID=3110540 RepID=UPI00237B95D2|nr:carbohydrate-binding protein [Paenibacillus humicola]